MEQKLRPIYNPTATLASTAAATLGAGMLPGMIGMSAPHVVGGVYGAYTAARALDKMTGARSPAQGFTDKFGDPNAAIRTPEPQAAPTAPVTTSVPQVTPPQNTALWGNPTAPEPTLRATLNSNAKVEEGMAKIAGKLQAQKRKDMIGDATPLLRQLAIKIKPVAEPAPETAQPKEDEAAVSDAPASPLIASVMAKMNGQSAPPTQAAPTTAPPAMAGNSAPTSMADILSNLNGAPKPPVIASINKKLNGKVTETPHPEEDQPYEPVENKWRKGLSDQEVADKALAQYEPAARKKYSKTIIENRSGNRNDLEAIARDHEADGAAIEALYHDLDHVSSRAKARKSITHFTHFMSPQAAKAVHARYTDKLISQRWKD